MDADLCSTLGRDEQITLSWPGPGVLAPMLGDIYGTGSPPPATGVRGYYHRVNLDILHKKSYILCIFAY